MSGQVFLNMSLVLRKLGEHSSNCSHSCKSCSMPSLFWITTWSRCGHPIGRRSLASPLDGTVSSRFPLPPPLQQRWQIHIPQLTQCLTHNLSMVNWLLLTLNRFTYLCNLLTHKFLLSTTFYDCSQICY